MLRGCLAALLLLGLLVGAYFWWLDQVFEMPGSLIGAGVVGFIVFCCIGAIQNAGRAYKDWSLASLAKHDVRPTGGQMIAVSGTIHPLHEPLVAPFSGQECVICEYDLASQHRPVKKSDGKPNGSDYCGFLMTPSVIRSRLGDVRLLGYPMLEGFEESRCVGYDSARNAEQFLTSRQFEDRTGLKMVTLFNVFGQVWSDDDGHVEKNIKIGNVEPAELFDRQLQTDMAKYSAWERDNPEQARKFSGSYELDDEEEDDLDEEDEQTFESKGFTSTVPIMTETRVRPGEPVCAFGIFDEFKMGLCPPRGSTKANRLLRGTAEEIEARSRKSIVSNLVGGIVVFLIANAALYGVMQIYLHSPDVAEDRLGRAFVAAQKGDLELLKSLARRKFDLNMPRKDGDTLLMVASDPAVSQWLIDEGADINAVGSSGMTPLMVAARYGRLEIVKQLLAAKADVNLVNPKTQRTALREADETGNEPIAALLRAAGAKDDVVTFRNGEPLPNEGGPQLKAVKGYLAAMQAADVPALRALVSSDNGFDFNGDWDVWKKVHLKSVEAYEGFVRGDDATLTVFGRSGEGFPTRWSYQLRREQGEWKIVRENWLVQ